MRFRKKPVVIDAVQWTGDQGAIHSFVSRFPDARKVGVFEGDRFVICTLEGDMSASLGDWIIRGVKGEFYPCKPDIFEATYEKVKTFEAGDVVRVRASDLAPAGLPMTIEDVCSFIPGKGVGVRCVWFNEHGTMSRDVFDPSHLEHTNDRMVDGKVVRNGART